jgi:hypothetical protein
MGVNHEVARLDRARFNDAIQRRTPHVFVTPAIVAANVAVYLWMVATGVHPV